MQKIIAYFQEVKAELQKVTWPTQQVTKNLTWLVVGVSLGVAIYLGLLDATFQKLIELVIS